MGTPLEQILSNTDVFQQHLLPFLSCRDAVRMETTSMTCRRALVENNAAGWKVLCQRDYWDNEVDGTAAPIYSDEHRSFDSLVEQKTWKLAYVKWAFWHEFTNHTIQPKHCVEAIHLWIRLKRVLRESNLANVLESLRPCPDRLTFRSTWGNLPSSFLAFCSVHGGQEALNPRSSNSEFFAGLLGSYSCYDDFYSLRLIPVTSETAPEGLALSSGEIVIGTSVGEPRTFLRLASQVPHPEGQLKVTNSRRSVTVVGQGGMLSYMTEYVKRLELGVYKRWERILPSVPDTCGISLFPDAGDLMSCAVTQGVEVRASARYFPAMNSPNFGYSMRIRVLPECDTPCQLVGRHLEFVDGNGESRIVNGEAVVGKQPMLFLDANGKSGYVDLGPAGEGESFCDTEFVYCSQTGVIRGPTNNGVACVKGSFSFVPGSIESPLGEVFHVTLAPFPLKIPSPFY